MVYKIATGIVLTLWLMSCKKNPIFTTHYKPISKNKNRTTKPINDSLISNYIVKNQYYTEYSDLIKTFYQKRNYDYIWVSKEGLTDRAALFFNLLSNAENTSDFTIDSLNAFYNYIISDSIPERSKDSLKNLELKTTLRFFDFAKKEWAGSNQEIARKMEWFIPVKKLYYDQILETFVVKNTDTSLLFKAPVYSQYELLRLHLSKYHALASDSTVKLLKPSFKAHVLGDSSIEIRQIKAKLALFQDYDAKKDTSQKFDTLFQKAVMKFQSRNGLTIDGKIGKAMIAELNVSFQHRKEQIMINMERCKWVPFELTGDYLLVNIPEFKLYVYENNKLSWNTNVVVGKATNKTIIFNGNLKYVVLNPYWTVTSNIFQKEMVPHLRKNPNYAASNNMELTKGTNFTELIDPNTINWFSKSSRYSGYTMRQKPGPNNSLGKVKFIFPNHYSIYLHDTPAKSLFKESSRSFSHGCIRVENPEKLALFLLRNQKGWDKQRLEKAWVQPHEQYIALKDSVPVIIAYFTAWVDDEGELNFRKDIYGHDKRMAKMLLFNKY